MEIKHRFHNSVLIIELPSGDGEFIKESIEILIKEIKNISDTKKIALDMKNKKFLNSSGLGEMIKTKDILLDEGIDLILISVSPRIESLIDMVGLNNFFTIVASENDL